MCQCDWIERDLRRPQQTLRALSSRTLQTQISVTWKGENTVRPPLTNSKPVGQSCDFITMHGIQVDD